MQYFVFLNDILILNFFFFNDTATTEIYTLSLHDALPISEGGSERHLAREPRVDPLAASRRPGVHDQDRKSTRLNSSHSQISYAVFCLKKKNINIFNTVFRLSLLRLLRMVDRCDTAAGLAY